MNNSHALNLQHQQTLRNIPWLVTDRLTAAEHAAASAHIAHCHTCQQELALQQRIRALMLTPVAVEIAPQASFHKLRSRIEELERELPGESSAELSNEARQEPHSVSQLSTPPAPAWFRPVMLGQLAAGVLAASLLLWMVVERWTAPRFQTATSSLSYLPGPALRVVAAPTMTIAEFSTLVQGVQGRVVAGPNTQNAWTIVLPPTTDARARDALLAQWRSNPQLIFAEPVAQAGTP